MPLLGRLDALVSRIEALIPSACGISAPDWSGSVAFRYRKRLNGQASLEPVRHVASMRLDDVREVDSQKEKSSETPSDLSKACPPTTFC